jgi:hypothetical protein
VIIGNPPYGADLTNSERFYLDKLFNIGSSDTAILFIKKAKNLLNDNGYLGFIIPKAFSFASNYQKIRENIWYNLKILIDCRKVWKEVLLEQVIAIINNNSQSQYDTGILVNHKIEIIGRIEKETAKKFGFFINGISEIETNIGMKILNNTIPLKKISINRRGAMLQQYIIQGYPIKDDEIKIIGGAEINKFGLKGFKGKVNKNSNEIEQALIKENSILVQNIIAHIENPVDHIKITACIPETNDFAITDTINQITIHTDYAPQYIWSILNSKLMNWYSYRFIFGKAIRTMHFDNSVTSRIPIIELTKSQQQFTDTANIMLEKNKELQVIRNKFLNFLKAKFDLEKPSTKILNWFDLEFKDFIAELKKAKVVLTLQDEMAWQSLLEQNKSEALTIQAIIAETDKKIDTMVYKLYDLTYEEVKIIDPNFDLSKEWYDGFEE